MTVTTNANCCGEETTTKCTCGDAGCPSCKPGRFVRPRFFAGQLLTEEDLSVLSEYVVAKNRLHNRHLFGEGVVCGLQVHCHPCGDGKVIVESGHALDCCGNDIVVPCPEELDVNRLIHDLRVRLLGHDCGDPCIEDKSGAKSDCDEGDEPEKDVTREYCLYIKYCEEHSDPVAPYATDEPCGHQACEATRIREGYCFELRCPGEDRAPPDILDKFRDCLGELSELRSIASNAKSANGYYGSLKSANERVARADFLVWTPVAEKELQAQVATTNALFEKCADVEFATVATAFEETNRLVVRKRLSRVSDAVIGKSTKKAASAKSKAKALETRNLTEQFAKLHAERKQSLDHLTNLRAEAVLVYAKNYASTTGPLDPASAPEALEFAGGGLRYSKLNSAHVTNLSTIRDWLLHRLERSTKLTDCALICDLKAATLQVSSKTDGFVLLQSALTIALGLLRYLLCCLCDALNPPCTPCEDPSVLLACLKVKDCKVEFICNLERTYVLSPAAIRYWLPPIGIIGDLFERLCCDIGYKLAQTKLSGGLNVRIPSNFTTLATNALFQRLRLNKTEQEDLAVTIKDLGDLTGTRTRTGNVVEILQLRT